MQLDDTIACWQKQYEIKWNSKQQLKRTHECNQWYSKKTIEEQQKNNVEWKKSENNKVEKQTYMKNVCIF